MSEARAFGSAVTPLVDRSSALARLARRSPVERLLGRRGRDPATGRSHLELLWTPRYVARVCFGSASPLSLSVCGLIGTAVRLAPEVEALAMDSSPPAAPTLDGEVLASAVDRNIAEQAARRFALHTLAVFRRRDDEVAGVELFPRLWPLWREIVERRDGTCDLRLLDAVTGQPAGTAARHAVLRAFARKLQEGPRLRGADHTMIRRS